MLRRRILASAMASVMAIGSIAVVANAEDTAVATKQVKTKADLEAYVKSFDSFRSDKIYDYGSVSGEDFLDAIEYADNVLASDKSSVDDYTVAYSMLESVYNKLTIYSAEELTALVKACQKDYDSANILNEELGDAIYDADKFATFETAFEDAESVLGSSDSRIITDAYETLDAAKKDLKSLDVVTKSAFRSVLKDYETALQKEYAYDSWRVGTVDAGYWGYNQNVAYGTLYDHVSSIETEVNKAYDEMDNIKALSKTTQENIVKAYKAAKQAAALLNGFKADDTNRATKANVKSLLNEYHGRLVHDYVTTAANALYAQVVAALGASKVEVTVADGDYSTTTKTADKITDNSFWYVDSAEYDVNPNGGRYNAIIAEGKHAGEKKTVEKLISAEISVKSTETAFYIEVDDEGYAVYTTDKDGKPVFNISTKKDGMNKYKLVSKKAWVDLTSLIEVKASDIDAATADNHYYNNVVDGDYFEYTPFIDKTTLKSFAVATSGEPWVATQFADALKADNLITNYNADDKTGDIADSFITNIKGLAGVYKDSDALYNALQALTTEAAAYGNWTVKDKFVPYYFGEVDKLGSLTNQIGQWGVDDMGVDYANQKMDGTTHNGEKTYTELDKAIEIAQYYVNSDTKTIKEDAKANKDKIGYIDTIDAIKEGSASGSSTEWALVYRYLKYALSDKYDATYGTNTKKDVQELVEKAYDLAEKTGDAALFNYHHMDLVNARQDALDWLKGVNKIKDYKDNKTSFNGKVATNVYNDLKNAYDALEKDYNAFKYSFTDVYNKIADVKSMIDDGDLTATDSLTAALTEAAYRLSVVEPLEDLDDNEAFTADRDFQGFNRVYTNTDTGNGYELQVAVNDKKSLPKANDGSDAASHYNLMKAYEALVAEVNKQLNPEVKLGDVNKDGVVNALDAAAILKAVAAGTAIDVKVGDFNADGVVNALDASAILKSVTQA